MAILESLFDTKFVRYGLVGILATLVHVGTFTFLVEALGFTPVIASVPSFVLAMLSAYIVNYSWTFTSSGAHLVQLPKYVTVSAICFCLNVAITYLVVNVFSFWYPIALLMVVSVIPALSFSMNKLWTFRVDG